MLLDSVVTCRSAACTPRFSQSASLVAKRLICRFLSQVNSRSSASLQTQRLQIGITVGRWRESAHSLPSLLHRRMAAQLRR